jgi:maleylpyruvate isomerase
MMRLYDYWRSSSAWRVRIALAYKGIPHERSAVSLIRDGGEQNRPEFRALNPMTQVPVLELDAAEPDMDTEMGGVRTIAQSIAIIHYLEERFPSPPLLPAAPWPRARARQLAEMVNAGIQPFQNMPATQYVKDKLGGDPAAWIRHFVSRGLAALEEAAAETAGRFLVGDEVSIADVYLVPQLYGARRYDLDLGGLPTLLRVEATCAALPAFQAAHPDRQPDKPPA